jgi:hypothetical protein
MGLSENIKRNISNIPGWRTSKKIVVIESDDWGSIRMSSIESYQRLLSLGFPVNQSHYNKFDSLESNEDLSSLFEMLNKFKDKNGSNPVVTAVSIVGNPDFKKILDSDFKSYHYEPFTETLKRYPNHDKVYTLYKEGINDRLFVPVFHGREHLNVKRWMTDLQNGNKSVIQAFNEGVTGVDRGSNNEPLSDFQAAFDIDKPDDTLYLKEVLTEGLTLFEELFGYQAEYFVPTNGPFNNSLEQVLQENGVKLINTAKKQIEPLGDGKINTNIRFLGKKNNLGQYYITRNCFFEPSSFEHSSEKNWVNDCLKEIEIAFRWKKPAIISSHRVNYIGNLNKSNRVKGLSLLEELLTKMLAKWPDIEFMTSVELGKEIYEG